MLKQKKPIHPGRILKENFLKPLAINQTECASNLGITRKTLSSLLNERQGISIDMAVRLAKAFCNTPEFWMGLQCRYNVWHALKNGKLAKIRAYEKVNPKAVNRGSRNRRVK